MKITRTLAIGTIVLTAGLGSALAQGPAGGRGRGPGQPGLALSSPDFEDGAVIPNKYTQADPNPVSPKLEWKNVPAGTQSFVLLMHDPDVSMGKKTDDVTHWMAFNIPGTATELAQGQPADAKLADGTIQIVNTGRKVGFMGSGAPPGPYHHYTWELFALDTKLDLGPDAMRDQVVAAMQGHILGKGVLVGRFHR
ncbi:MAG TPA: YbhB/YbcL family Raf kinase inhibitor-like protein [Bryobacteraceae bacterium]|jgi:Raf kinase inhibitor-like YbhB/YbcL family protein|nr:YbhB/YbcL family Raf kinase inhibitor-like protein [Bryobacteraceae bacterium]